MIDPEKWNAASDEMKMQTIKVMKTVVKDSSITKTDNEIIADYLLDKVEEDK